jgi:hypothetical protein
MIRTPQAGSAAKQDRSVLRRLVHLSGTGGLLLICAGLLAGCPGRGPRDFENVNDQLRRENMELRRQLVDLEQTIERRMDQIHSLQQQLATEPPAVPEAELVQFTAVRIGRYSGVLDTTRDGSEDTLRVYVHTLDQHGRFMPANGRAEIQAVAVAPGREPVVLAERAFSPAEFTAAYRTGFTGTHYTLETPLQTAVPPGVDRATIVVRFTEARTGVSVTRDTVVPVRGARPPLPEPSLPDDSAPPG